MNLREFIEDNLMPLLLLALMAIVASPLWMILGGVMLTDLYTHRERMAAIAAGVCPEDR